ncbi:sensor histidine kinase [Gorillibacterium massiliense]|uniref:sensor histidine kinase n=1 Tax=Gorillibacterium massiliense TaxID=1280390 RepID=UPI0004B436FB|nr:sensor histidine kinase [Gorillibacterium massiliense]
MKRFERFRSMKLKHKLVLLNSLLIVISLGTLSYIAYKQSSKSLNSEVLFSTKQVLNQTESFLSYKIGKIEDVSDAIVLDNNLNEMLNRPASKYELSEQLGDFRNFYINLTTFQKNDDIYRIRVYIPDELAYSNEGVNFFPYSQFTSSKEYTALSQYLGKIMWVTDRDAITSMIHPDLPTVHAIRFIRNLSSFDSRLGMLDIDVRQDVLSSIVKRANTSANGVAYLQNAEGEIIAASNTELTKQWNLNLESVFSIALQNDPWRTITLSGKNVMAGVKTIEGTDWNLVSIVPLQDLYASGKKVRNQILAFMILLAIAANLLVYWISSSQTRRIGMVIRKMRRVQTGELEPVISDGRQDEVGQLVETYNYMVSRMKVILDEQYKLGVEAKNAELKALHSQINPHFLYNTLDLINWTAIQRKVPEISSLVQSLSQFYKLSLNKGEEVTTLGKELEHARLYVDIQNRRFGNSIELNIDVDEELFEYDIPKITLQPIVENAILHGIRETAHRRGEIFIYSYCENGDIILVVQDNGIGISEDQINSLNGSYDSNANKDGYGIRNINYRIRLLFGLTYGLHFESQLGEGTKVFIRLPRIKNDGR